jgi:prepilin-type N-terminal cleavage/methylation domain-containing protein
MRRARGFTLIEVLIVVVLLGLIGALASRLLRAEVEAFQVANAARQLAGDLSRSAVEAMRRNRSLTLTRTGVSGYSIEQIGTRTLPDGVTFDEARSASTVRFATLGPPVTGAATFVLRRADLQRTVRVTSSGLVVVE